MRRRRKALAITILFEDRAKLCELNGFLKPARLNQVDRVSQVPLKLSLLLAASLAGAAHGAGPVNGAQADSPWALCPPITPAIPAGVVPAQLSPGLTQITADEVLAESQSRTLLHGNVIIQRDDIILQGGEAEYDRIEDRLQLRDRVVYQTEAATIEGDSAMVFLDRNHGEIINTRFLFPEIHAFGSAGRIAFQGTEHVELREVRYTTCPPEKEDWVLRASELNLDQESNTGEAWHALLTFKGIPLLYSPYLNFPLEGRKSGLLPPTFSSSGKNGTDISLPYYWNIAPNQDATITPRNMSARGGMLQTEYRFLTENSSGQVNGDYLANDKIYGDDRSYFSARYQRRLGRGWDSDLLYQTVSDAFYFDDLGGSQESTSQTHLERHFIVDFRNPYWHFLGRTQDYQALTGTEPYQRLPQLMLSGQSPRRRNHLQLGLESEVVNFQHDTLVPTGSRVDVKPSLSLPLQGNAWFITPKLAWRYSRYQLQDNPGGDDLTRSLPIASLDSGLFFERELRLGRGYTQTLEPRLYYLEVPFRDQDALPLFDTALSDFSFGQMFRDNRFIGVDRQGDARQLALALTSRFIEGPTGKERFTASIGQLHYLQDREVTLIPGDVPETARRSDLFGEVTARPGQGLHLRVTEQWNPEAERTERLGLRVNYSPRDRQLLGLNYRFYRPTQQRQADAIALWPLARQWRFVGRWNYDLENERSLDTIGGIEYESCCWITRLVARAYRTAIDEELNHSLLVNFELKGLATLGKRLEDAVGRDILDTNSTY